VWPPATSSRRRQAALWNARAPPLSVFSAAILLLKSANGSFLQLAQNAMSERLFDIRLVAGLALREQQIQRNYRPPITVRKLFARRPGAAFRALVLSEFVDSPLRESCRDSHDLEERCIADPFTGGGTPLAGHRDSVSELFALENRELS